MDTLLFIISKLVAAVIKVETWLLLGMALALLGLLTRRLLLARWLLASTLLVTLLLAGLPLGGLLLQPLENRYPANPALTHVDGIVILGGGEDGSKSRFWGQVHLAQENSAGHLERLVSRYEPVPEPGLAGLLEWGLMRRQAFVPLARLRGVLLPGWRVLPPLRVRRVPGLRWMPKRCASWLARCTGFRIRTACG